MSFKLGFQPNYMIFAMLYNSRIPYDYNMHVYIFMISIHGYDFENTKYDLARKLHIFYWFLDKPHEFTYWFLIPQKHNF